MRITIGVDGERQYERALSLIARLEFTSPDLVATRGAGRSAIPTSHPHTHPLPELRPAERSLRAGPVLLDQMPDEAGFHLLCEGEVRSEGRVRCLFATDHSVYADQALELFLKLGPKGIEELTVFTAIEPTCRMVVANLHRHLADGIAGVQDAREVARQGTELAKSLEAQGIRSTARLRTGLVTHLIDAAMKETRSDLLILGARGYGAMGPRPIGSVASTIVHSATYPVLVVRV